jgi:DNA-binding CsgD family transcriptional regulator
MDAASTGNSQDDAWAADSRRWLRDLGALLALPAMWVDHEPAEIASGLLSVLFGVLQLDGAYARFDDPQRGGGPLETWRPSGSRMPAELRLVLDSATPQAQGVATTAVETPGLEPLRVTRVPLALPWETGLVLVSSVRSDFPTAMETHLLRVAVSQAAIAIHTARRLAHEHAARVVAEAALVRQDELLRSLVADVEPSLMSLSRRVQEASRLLAELDALHVTTPPVTTPPGAVPPGAAPPVAGREARGDSADRTEGAPARALQPALTRREIETLGLLAQGLSNKEIAGVMWLSDRTVERHITSLYRKIGVARRSEATAFALRHGVV